MLLEEGLARDRLKHLTKRLRLEHSVLLLGRVGNLERWYRRADLFVLNPRYEGFPNTLLEAMGYGAPVMSFPCGTSPSKMIKHGCNGYLVEPNDSESLAQSLEKLMDDEAFRLKLRLNATEVKERISMECAGHRWSKIFGLIK